MDDPIRELRVWHRFHVRITALYALSVFAVLTLAAVAQWRWSVEARMGALRGRLLNSVAAVAWSISDADVRGPTPETVERLERRFAELGALDPDLRGMYVLAVTDVPGRLEFVADWSRHPEDEAATGTPYDATGLPVLRQGLERPVVESRLYRDAWGWTLSSYAPIRDGSGATVGLVGIDVADEEIAAIRWVVLRRTATIWVLSLGLVGLAAAVVARSVREPLGRTIRATAAIARGRLDTRLGLERADEFGVLGRHFDGMARDLEDRERIRGTFGRYVSEDVAAQLLAQPGGPALGGDTVECTILFSDLRGYSTISERVTPSELVSILNQYLAAMQSVIDAHHGTVIEFLGDAILAVFGAPVARGEHAESAVRCALGMREQMIALNRRWEADGIARAWTGAGLPSLAHRVGIHTGRALAGNLGSATRMKFTVIGDAVNVASRLEQLNKDLGSDILLSEDTFRALSADLAAACRDHGEVEVKGRAQPVRVYTVDPG